MFLIKGKTVTVKMKMTNFVVMTRASTLACHTREKTVMFRAAKDIIQTEMKARQPDHLRLRLMGCCITLLFHCVS